MVIINNSILPFGKSYIAINLFGIVFAKEWLSESFLRHERIHTSQQKELLFVGFYIIYILEWLVRMLICKSARKAYRTISFEREAYDNQDSPDYVSNRRRFAWMKYF